MLKVLKLCHNVLGPEINKKVCLWVWYCPFCKIGCSGNSTRNEGWEQ